MADRDAAVGGAIVHRGLDLQALADTELGRWEIACHAACKLSSAMVASGVPAGLKLAYAMMPARAAAKSPWLTSWTARA